jgi:dTDP-4-dehydrorhamnose reductase
MPKVLITGAGGQVGRILLESAPANWNAVGFTRKDLDIGNQSAVVATIHSQRPDLILNAGAYTAVDKAESEPEAAERINSAGPRHLALAAREVGARLIHISTDFVFDGHGSRPYQPAAATNPQGVYGRTKRHGEEAVLEVLHDNSVILRTAWVYAAEGNNFVRTMLRLMGSKGHVRVISDQIGTPTSARSLVNAIWAVAERPSVRGIHHWTDLGVASWYDFAVAIAEEAVILGLVPADVRVDPISTEEYPTPAKRPAYSVLDKRSLLEALAIPAQHWRTNLRSVLRELAKEKPLS